MTTAGSFDAPIEIFGGLVTDMSPADLPHGVSPDCQDVIFSNGGVATRPGLQALFGPLAGNPTVNYVKTYETLSATLRTMVLDSNGVLYKETIPGTLSSIATALVPNAFANSTTLFGREYLAISDGKTGNDLPRQYDDTNFDRVSQGGPGAGPTVVDENVTVAISASPTARFPSLRRQPPHNLRTSRAPRRSPLRAEAQWPPQPQRSRPPPRMDLSPGSL